MHYIIRHLNQSIQLIGNYNLIAVKLSKKVKTRSLKPLCYRVAVPTNKIFLRKMVCWRYFNDF